MSTSWYANPGGKLGIMGIYLDYQASTPIDPRIKAKMLRVMDIDFANPSSDNHIAGWNARDRVDHARATISNAICCDAHELIFTSGATEANNIAVLGAALGAPSNRRRILVGSTDHKAVIEAAFAAELYGYKVELIPVDSQGLINHSEFKRMLNQEVAVVSIMLVNNEIGTIQPLDELVNLCQAAGAFFHTDATQAPAAMCIDVQKLRVSAASFSSHKIYGPKGIGALYLASNAPWKPRPLMFGGGQEYGLRPGTVPTHLCTGFAAAFDIISNEGMSERTKISKLRNQFKSLLQDAVPTFKLTADASMKHPGNLHGRFEGVDADDLLARLQPEVHAATGSACTSGFTRHSHVLLAIGQNSSIARQGVRFSIGRFTTSQEISRAVELISGAVHRSMYASI